VTPSELVARFRLDVRDDQAPYLWSDVEIWGYLNHSIQRWLGAPGGGVRDASTSIVSLTVSISDPWIAISPLITKIRSARLNSTKRTLEVITLEHLLGMQGMANNQFPVSTDDLDLTGNIKALVIGMERNKLRVVRIPLATDTVKLVVERRSIYTHAPPTAAAAPVAVTSITRSGTTATATTTAPHGLLTGTAVVLLAGATQADYVGTFPVIVTDDNKFIFTVASTAVTPATGTITWAPGAEFAIEIDEFYHLDLLAGMKALAYSKEDADTFDKSKADENETKFLANVTKHATDRARQDHTPRLMTYGGY
jgi:hypothetical protein